MHAKLFFDLLVFKTQMNLRREVSRYYLNYLWWLVDPVLNMMVLYTVFGIFLNRKTEFFIAFLLCGVTSWQWFARTVTNCSDSIVCGKWLMLQVNLPKVFFPFEVLLRDAVKSIFAFLLLVIFLVVYPTPITQKWLCLPIIFCVQFAFNAGIGLLCAAVVPFVPDLKYIIVSIIQLGFFASGIFYNIDKVVLPEHRALMYLNPMAGIIKSYRQALVFNEWPSWEYLGAVALVSLVLISLACLIISRLDHIYPKVCQQ